MARRVKTMNFIDRTVLFRTEPHDPRESLLSHESIFCFPLKKKRNITKPYVMNIVTLD